MNPPDIPKPKRRKISKEDAEQMAKLLSKRITERGACYMLGIKPDTWVQWKRRAENESKFERELTLARESRLDGIIEAIDKAGESTEVITKNGTKYTRPGDWRARAWIAERVLAPERFAADRASTAPGGGQVNVQVNLILAGIAQVFAGFIEDAAPSRK